MKKVSLSICIFASVLFLAGCSSDSQKVQKLESKIASLEKENQELKQQGGILPPKKEDKKKATSKVGARSNPVPVGEEVTFNPLYVNENVKLTVKVTDVKKGSEAEQEVVQYEKIHLDTAKSNMGGLKETTEFLVYTLTIKPSGINKDEGIRLPGLSNSLTIDGDDLGYSRPIDNLDGFSNEGNVYVDKEYKFKMYGKIEKGKDGLVCLTELNSKVFFKVS